MGTNEKNIVMCRTMFCTTFKVLFLCSVVVSAATNSTVADSNTTLGHQNVTPTEVIPKTDVNNHNGTEMHGEVQNNNTKNILIKDDSNNTSKTKPDVRMTIDSATKQPSNASRILSDNSTTSSNVTKNLTNTIILNNSKTLDDATKMVIDKSTKLANATKHLINNTSSNGNKIQPKVEDNSDKKYQYALINNLDGNNKTSKMKPDDVTIFKVFDDSNGNSRKLTNNTIKQLNDTAGLKSHNPIIFSGVTENRRLINPKTATDTVKLIEGISTKLDNTTDLDKTTMNANKYLNNSSTNTTDADGTKINISESTTRPLSSTNNTVAAGTKGNTSASSTRPHSSTNTTAAAGTGDNASASSTRPHSSINTTAAADTMKNTSENTARPHSSINTTAAADAIRNTPENTASPHSSTNTTAGAGTMEKTSANTTSRHSSTNTTTGAGTIENTSANTTTQQSSTSIATAADTIGKTVTNTTRPHSSTNATADADMKVNTTASTTKSHSSTNITADAGTKEITTASSTRPPTSTWHVILIIMTVLLSGCAIGACGKYLLKKNYNRSKYRRRRTDNPEVRYLLIDNNRDGNVVIKNE